MFCIKFLSSESSLHPFLTKNYMQNILPMLSDPLQIIRLNSSRLCLMILKNSLSDMNDARLIEKLLTELLATYFNIDNSFSYSMNFLQELAAISLKFPNISPEWLINFWIKVWSNSNSRDSQNIIELLWINFINTIEVRGWKDIAVNLISQNRTSPCEILSYASIHWESFAAANIDIKEQPHAAYKLLLSYVNNRPFNVNIYFDSEADRFQKLLATFSKESKVNLDKIFKVACPPWTVAWGSFDHLDSDQPYVEYRCNSYEYDQEYYEIRFRNLSNVQFSSPINTYSRRSDKWTVLYFSKPISSKQQVSLFDSSEQLVGIIYIP